jgi:hypothetical protein
MDLAIDARQDTCCTFSQDSGARHLTGDGTVTSFSGFQHTITAETFMLSFCIFVAATE